MMIPVRPGRIPEIELIADVANATDLRVELRVSSKPENHTPDVTLATQTLKLSAGNGQRLKLNFDCATDAVRYAFVCLFKNEAVSIALSDQRVTGILSVCHNGNKAVAKSSRQTPPPDIGIDSFDFWTPLRRPEGKNFALKLSPSLDVFSAANLRNGIARPTNQPNAWVAAFTDAAPTLTISWPSAQSITCIELSFDTDFDHPMESVLLGHPERVMPFCVQRFEILDDTGALVFQCDDNHQTHCSVRLPKPMVTRQLVLKLHAPAPSIPAALLAVRCYSEAR